MNAGWKHLRNTRVEMPGVMFVCHRGASRSPSCDINPSAVRKMPGDSSFPKTSNWWKPRTVITFRTVRVQFCLCRSLGLIYFFPGRETVARVFFHVNQRESDYLHTCTVPASSFVLIGDNSIAICAKPQPPSDNLSGLKKRRTNGEKKNSLIFHATIRDRTHKNPSTFQCFIHGSSWFRPSSKGDPQRSFQFSDKEIISYPFQYISS